MADAQKGISDLEGFFFNPADRATGKQARITQIVNGMTQ